MRGGPPPVAGAARGPGRGGCCCRGFEILREEHDGKNCPGRSDLPVRIRAAAHPDPRLAPDSPWKRGRQPPAPAEAEAEAEGEARGDSARGVVPARPCSSRPSSRGLPPRDCTRVPKLGSWMALRIFTGGSFSKLWGSASAPARLPRPPHSVPSAFTSTKPVVPPVPHPEGGRRPHSAACALTGHRCPGHSAAAIPPRKGNFVASVTRSECLKVSASSCESE
jgi:hypothetical protein